MSESGEATRGYKAPMPELGQSVWWYPGGEKSASPHPAIVTRLGHDSVCLGVLAPDNYNLLVRDGVRHVSDPRTKRDEMRENGGWDFTARDRAVEQLRQQVTALLKRAGLEGEKAKVA